MAIVPVNVARVSQNLRSTHLLNTVRANQLELFRTQNQLATGLRFQTPSDDPTGAAAAQAVDRQLDRVRQVETNLNTATSVVSAAETAMDEALEAIRDVQAIALEGVNDAISAKERAALAVVVDAHIDQLISIGNSKYLNTYLFSGHRTAQTPFEQALGGVMFNGDDGRREAVVDLDPLARRLHDLRAGTSSARSRHLWQAPSILHQRRPPRHASSTCADPTASRPSSAASHSAPAASRPRSTSAAPRRSATCSTG